MTLVWWLIIFVFYCGQAYISKLNNNIGGQWFYFAWLSSIIPIWALIARHSKTLLIDGIIYDVVLFISYVLTFTLLGEAKGFNWQQWLGLIITIFGVLLMKVRI